MKSKLTISLADSPSDLNEVYRLTYKCYLNANLVSEKEDERIIHDVQLDASDSTYIIIAKLNDHIIGTSTVTIDSPVGLPTDCMSFISETNKLRNKGQKIAATWRLAIHPDYNSSTKILKEIILKIVEMFYINGVDTMLFTFSPKHAKIYSRILNLTPVTLGVDHNPDIKESEKETVLMRGSIADLPAKWKLHLRQIRSA